MGCGEEGKAPGVNQKKKRQEEHVKILKVGEKKRSRRANNLQWGRISKGEESKEFKRPRNLGTMNGVKSCLAITKGRIRSQVRTKLSKGRTRKERKVDSKKERK